MPELVLVKLGGSLLTDKRRARRARPGVIARLAGEIAEARRLPDMPAILLGHGSGSFGHHAALRHGFAAGAETPPRPADVAAVQRAAAELHLRVVDALAAAGAAPFSLAPSSFAVASGGSPRRVLAEPAAYALRFGLLPVVYGDIAVDRLDGASILATERVLRALAMRLRRSGFDIVRALWLGETDGVYDGAGETIARIDRQSYRSVLRQVGAPAGADVTGGMMLRLETAHGLAQQGIESWIFNGMTPGSLLAALRGETVPGTRFVP